MLRMCAACGLAILIVAIPTISDSPPARAALPSAECTPTGSYRHCYPVGFETTTQPNGGSAKWTDANYNPNCNNTAFIIQDFWFVGPDAPGDAMQWSEFGHQSCKNDPQTHAGGQYWVIYTSLYNNACGCMKSGYVLRQSVSTQQRHRYEIRANGNGTQTFQIDQTQIYTGVGYENTPFLYTSGAYVETGVETAMLWNTNVFPIWARQVSEMTVIPASCGCNDYHVAWWGPFAGPDCGNLSAVTPDSCRRDSPLDGIAYTPTWYRYWGN